MGILFFLGAAVVILAFASKRNEDDSKKGVFVRGHNLVHYIGSLANNLTPKVGKSFAIADADALNMPKTAQALASDDPNTILSNLPNDEFFPMELIHEVFPVGTARLSPRRAVQKIQAAKQAPEGIRENL